MKVTDLDYELPESLIATTPPPTRDGAPRVGGERQREGRAGRGERRDPVRARGRGEGGRGERDERREERDGPHGRRGVSDTATITGSVRRSPEAVL